MMIYSHTQLRTVELLSYQSKLLKQSRTTSVTTIRMIGVLQILDI